MFYFDPTYLVIIPALILSLWASARVNTTFNKYSRVGSRRGLTGAQAARRVLDNHGLYHVQIEYVRGHLSDHYDPSTQTLRLSESVYGNTSTAAIGVACHEAGHAIQHAEQYAPLKLRQAIIPITNIGSQFGIFLFMIGLVINIFASSDSMFGMGMAWAGIALFSFTAVFQLITLPTEFNASSRALEEIEHSGILYADEIPSAKKVLNAAAMTYVAALAVSLANLLRLFMMVNRNSRR